MKILTSHLNEHQRKQYMRNRQLALTLLHLWARKGKPTGYLPFRYQGEVWKLYTFKYRYQVAGVPTDRELRGITVWNHKGQYEFYFDVTFKPKPKP